MLFACLLTAGVVLVDRVAGGQVDLVGGYHDAGDNVKFGFPMAFSMTMLAWSVVEFGGLMKSELQHARDAVRWGADYLLKATAHPDTIYVQASGGLALAFLFLFLLGRVMVKQKRVTS